MICNILIKFEMNAVINVDRHSILQFYILYLYIYMRSYLTRMIMLLVNIYGLVNYSLDDIEMQQKLRKL